MDARVAASICASVGRLTGDAAQPGRSRNTAGLTGEDITVRLCQVPDAPAVLELWSKARSGHASTADRIEDVERLIADSPAALLVAEREAEIVGALIAAWDGWRGTCIGSPSETDIAGRASPSR